MEDLVITDESTGTQEVIKSIVFPSMKRTIKKMKNRYARNFNKSKRANNKINFKKTTCYHKKVCIRNFNRHERFMMYKIFSKSGEYIGKISSFGLKYHFAQKFKIKRNSLTFTAIVDIDDINDFCYEENNRLSTPSYNTNSHHCVLCNSYGTKLIRHGITHKQHSKLFLNKYSYCKNFSEVAVCYNCDNLFLEIMNRYNTEVIESIEALFPKKRIVDINHKIVNTFLQRDRFIYTLDKFIQYKTQEQITIMKNKIDSCMDDVMKLIYELNSYGIIIPDDYLDKYLNTTCNQKNLYCFDKIITLLFPTQIHYFDFCRKVFIKYCPTKYLSKHLTHGFDDLDKY